MGEIREVDYVTGIETSTPPTSGTPTDDADLVTKGYADATYTRLDNVLGTTATISSLRAFLSTDADRIDDQAAIVISTGATYTWDSTSTATDDGDAVVKPTDNPVTGRWLKISTGGGGGGSGGSSLESVMQKADAEKYGILTEDLDNSLVLSARFAPRQTDFIAYLLRQAAASSTVQLVINPKFVNDSDQNMDVTTNWSAVGAGASLTATSTAGEFYVGSAALKFDKNNSATRAAIRYDRGVQTFSVGQNTRVYAKVKLPSVTNLSNILLRMYAGSTSDFREFTASLQADGSALAIGENLVFWDISSGGTPSGAGWTSDQLSRYQEVGVNTSSAGQTYTGVIFDSLAFSYRYPEDLGLIGARWTIHDNSNSEALTFDAANARPDGLMTLSSALANTYAGGFSGASVALLRRSVMSIEGSVASFDETLSGAAALTQDLRLATFARGTISGSAKSFLEMIAVQNYKVTAVGGSTIDVDDFDDDHLNLLSGNTIEVYRPLKIDGITKYYFLFARALSANSSASAGTTTLTMTTTSVLVGDIVCKRHLVSQKVSLVGISPNNESYSALTLENDPDGVQLVEAGIKRVNPTNLFGDWLLGGQNELEALRNQPGAYGSALIKTGSPNLDDDGPFGMYAASGFSASDNLSIASALSTDLAGDSQKVQLAFMFNDKIGFNGAGRTLICRHSTGAEGYFVFFQSGANKFNIYSNNAIRSPDVSYTPGKWYGVFVRLNNGGTSSEVWIEGVGSGLFNTPISAGSGDFLVGRFQTGATFATGIAISALAAWSGGADISDSEILEMTTNPRARLLQRYLGKLAGQSGQKLSYEAVFARSTIAIKPKLWKTGLMIA